jgi:hypothetical protein
MKTLVVTVMATTLVFCAAVAAHAESGKAAGKENSAGISVRAEGISTTASDGGSASITVGGIEGDVDAQGVAVVNGRVSIDGKEVPAGVTRYKSPRTGTVYSIERKNGKVNVRSEGADK